MSEFILGVIESRFADLIWQNEPLATAIWMLGVMGVAGIQRDLADFTAPSFGRCNSAGG